MHNLSEKGIRYKFLRLSISSLLICLLLIAGMYFYMNKQQEEHTAQYTELTEKQELVKALSNSVNQLFFRIRGFYSFKYEQDLELAIAELESLKNTINRINSVSLTSDERKPIAELSSFLERYESEALPNSIAAVRADDYETLQQISRSGTNSEVNAFIAFADNYERASEKNLQQLNQTLLEEAENFSFMLMLLFLLLFLIVAFIILRALNDIVKPLEGMRESIEGFAGGEGVAYKPLERSDELGVLSMAFHDMIRTIQEKQIRLEESLEETEKTKEQLIRFNDLNHILSFTLDMQKLANAALHYFKDTYEIDSGVLWLPKTGEFALEGFTASMFMEFREERIPYLAERLKDRESFTMKREASHEKGIATGNVHIGDLYAAVKNEEQENIALLGLSRVGRTFSNEEELDISGLLNRIHLAVDRIQLYDAAIHERTLNERIINNINEGIQFIAKNGDMVQHNKTMCTMLDCGDIPLDATVEAEIWIRSMSEQTTMPEAMQEFLHNCIDEKEAVSNTYQYTVKEPHERVIDVYSTSVVVDKEKTGTIFVHRDVTREREVDKMKSELVSTVSHELRTPLSSVLGFTELLLNKQLKPEKQERYLKTIYKEAKRLTNLINDFLDLQRMESGNQVYRIGKLSMSEMIIETAEKFRTQTTHPIVFIDDASDVVIEGDRERLAQVLMNVIGNAIKFSPQGGNVTISVKNDAKNLHISVQDQGIGIPAEDIPKLFSKFQRIDNSSRRKIGGTGLGLAICQEIIGKHDGKIWIESEEGLGTSVHFELPLLSETTEYTVHEGAEENPPVMIVEDDMSLALLLSEELKLNGFKVIYHTNVEEAFKEAKRTQLVGAVVDIMLGEELNGWDLVDMLKKDAETKDIPIVISSALDPVADVQKITQINHYLVKPYAPVDLSKVMKKLLDGQHQDGVIFYPEKETASARNN